MPTRTSESSAASWEASARPRAISAARTRVVDDEHHLVADHLHHPAAPGHDHVVGEVLELVDHLGQLLVGHLLGQRGEPDQVGEPHDEPGTVLGVAPQQPAARGGLEVAAPHLLEHGGEDGQEALRLARDRARAPRRLAPRRPSAGPRPGQLTASIERRRDPRHRRPDHPGHAVGDLGAHHPAVHEVGDGRQVAEVDVGEHRLAGLRVGEAERTPDVAQLLLGEAGVLAGGGDVVAEVLPGARAGRSPGAASMPSVLGLADLCRRHPERLQQRDELVGGQARRCSWRASPDGLDRDRDRQARDAGTAARARPPAASSASPRRSVVDHAGSRRRDREPRGAPAGVRFELPEQRRPLAVPADGVREPTRRGREVVHLPPLSEPALGHAGAEGQPVVDLADEQPADGSDQRRVGRRGRGRCRSAGQVQVGPGRREERVEIGLRRRRPRNPRGEGAHVGGRPRLAAASSRSATPGSAAWPASASAPSSARARRGTSSGDQRSRGRARPSTSQVSDQCWAMAASAAPGRADAVVGRAGAARPSSANPSEIERAGDRRVRLRRAAGTACWRPRRRAADGWAPRCGHRPGSRPPTRTRPGRRPAASAGSTDAAPASGSATRSVAVWASGNRTGRRWPDRRRSGPRRPAPARHRPRTRPRRRRLPASDSAMRPGERGSTTAGAPSTRTSAPSSSIRSTLPVPLRS